MSIKYFNPEIHHRQSYRLNNWDYASSAYYFITVCAKTRQLYCFGDIINNKLILNNIGNIIKQCWLNIPDHFNHACLDEFIIMPNHVHGIIHIVPDNNKHPVGTCHGMSLQQKNTRQHHNTRKFSQPQKKSLSIIINHFKSSCTRILKQQNKIFVSFWQPRFHDHIIRNVRQRRIRRGRKLNIIRKYIRDNPKNWDKDKNNIMNYLKIGF